MKGFRHPNDLDIEYVSSHFIVLTHGSWLLSAAACGWRRSTEMAQLSGWCTTKRERTVGAATTTEKQTNERERKPFLFLLKINNLSSSNKKGEKNQMAADALVVMTTLSSR